MQHGHLIPPIIGDLLTQLDDRRLPMWQRDSLCERLEEIEKACARAIVKFKEARTRKHEHQQRSKA